MDEKIKRSALLNIRVKQFARQLREEGWAELIPEADQEWLTDEEIPEYKRRLELLRCVQRPDMRWEAN
jgi:hypothetical protein